MRWCYLLNSHRVWNINWLIFCCIKIDFPSHRCFQASLSTCKLHWSLLSSVDKIDGICSKVASIAVTSSATFAIVRQNSHHRIFKRTLSRVQSFMVKRNTGSSSFYGEFLLQLILCSVIGLLWWLEFDCEMIRKVQKYFWSLLIFLLFWSGYISCLFVVTV